MSESINWARCVRCQAETVRGKYYCAACLKLPKVTWKWPKWNGFEGKPNPAPYIYETIPYDRADPCGSRTVWVHWRTHKHYTKLELLWIRLKLYARQFRKETWR